MSIARNQHPIIKQLEPLVATLYALMAGMLFCIILAYFLGTGSFELISAIWEGAWGSPNAAAATLSKLTPLLLTGLAVSVAYQAGLLNIGCEGQLTLGALSAACFALTASQLPRLLLMPLTVLVGALAGALWTLPAMWLRQKRGVHEVVSTLLLNYVAIYLADYLARGPLGDGSAMARTAEIPLESTWRAVCSVGTIGVTAAPWAALIAMCLVHVWLYRTCGGYEAGACRSNPLAARAAGIPVNRRQTRSFLLSGALAGLAGALEVAAVHHRFYAAFSPGYGFDGITVAFLVNNVPGWTWLSALLIASLRAADKWLQLALGISPSTILVLQALLLITVASRVRLPVPGRTRRRSLLGHLFGYPEQTRQ
ncbi:ABC transporter permease [Desulfoferrobacter suflitae]|uniref:ABC transporter permease n=1 Tax=Desulfoferrobacter suflitae TaxID=2865782 RepID=UPI0021647C8C|nr:ABC transporter permease [Desulfoferrobacter suflitae]MCK8601021.1 ABC transporter permease [Desulfoferrobacter suflitae]